MELLGKAKEKQMLDGSYTLNTVPKIPIALCHGYCWLLQSVAASVISGRQLNGLG
jgi:hypothetical protein